MLKILRFSVAHFSNQDMCMCVCVHAPSTWIFCRFIFHKHIAFWALLSTNCIGCVLTDDGIWHVKWQIETHPTPPPPPILFARDWRLLVQLHRKMLAMYSSLALKSEKKVNPMPKQLSDCGPRVHEYFRALNKLSRYSDSQL